VAIRGRLPGPCQLVLAILVLVGPLAGVAQASEPSVGHPGRPRLVPGTPCVVTARACVDLTARRAWLITRGRVTGGPVPINIGGPGEETPVGTFRVWWKDRNHFSAQQHGTPMPYSVFFKHGVAFHGGSLQQASAGCVHLRLADAKRFYNTLRVGDLVQVARR
jgi:hypothetical protein